MSKLNKRELKIQFDWNFTKIYRNLELLYQVICDNENAKIIRYLVNVIPKPVTINAEIKCEIGSSVTEKIPLQSTLSTGENVKVEVMKTTKGHEFRLSKSGTFSL